ncbi:mCG141216, partial [Mus musculus]
HIHTSLKKKKGQQYSFWRRYLSCTLEEAHYVLEDSIPGKTMRISEVRTTF